jgi:hypothetical protein
MFVAAGVTRKGETPLAARSFLEVAYYGMPSQVCAPGLGLNQSLIRLSFFAGRQKPVDALSI